MVYRARRTSLLGTVVASAIFGVAAITAPVFANDDLQTHDITYLETLCASNADSKNDKETVHTCKALEQKAHEDWDEVTRLIYAKSTGQTLSYSDFGKVIKHMEANVIATSNIAIAYRRLGVFDFGRQYAIQAIEWSMYDAKDMHDLIVTLHRNPDAQPKDYQKARSALQQRLDSDKATAPSMEAMYPGTIQEATAKLNMSSETYQKLMDGF